MKRLVFTNKMYKNNFDNSLVTSNTDEAAMYVSDSKASKKDCTKIEI